MFFKLAKNTVLRPPEKLHPRNFKNVLNEPHVGLQSTCVPVLQCYINKDFQNYCPLTKFPKITNSVYIKNS